VLTQPIAYTEDDIDVLARTLFGEGRGEPLAGLYAIAWVVINRAKRAPRWPGTVAGVCLQSKQFSCWNGSDANLPKLRAATLKQPAFLRCYGAAAIVLAGSVHDLTRGADHYVTLALPAGARTWPPAWSVRMQPTEDIGGHRFFRSVLPRSPGAADSRVGGCSWPQGSPSVSG